MKLTFGNSNGTELVADNLKTIDEVWDNINNFLKDIKCKSHYQRVAGLSPKKTMIDYGSHYSFFYLNIGFDTYIKLFNKSKLKSKNDGQD